MTRDAAGSLHARTRPGTAGRLRDVAPTYLAAIEEHFTRHLDRREIAAVAGALQKVVDAEE